VGLAYSTDSLVDRRADGWLMDHGRIRLDGVAQAVRLRDAGRRFISALLGISRQRDRTIRAVPARTFFSRSKRVPELGHSPLGGWNVVAMLLLFQVGLGLFTIDAYGIESRALADHVSFGTGRRVAALHESVFNLLCVLVVLHVVAVLSYLIFKRENLILPMLTGVKRVRCSDVERGEGL
jgi:cytochrome b